MIDVHHGKVSAGYQFASDQAIKRPENPSPYSDSALKLQYEHFRDRDIDLKKLVPSIYWGTINIKLDYKVILIEPEFIARNVVWTDVIGAEDFFFAKCCICVCDQFSLGLIYYPSPSTKPNVNKHHYDVLEVICPFMSGVDLNADISLTVLNGVLARL